MLNAGSLIGQHEVAMDRAQRRHAIRNTIGHPNKGLSKAGRHLKSHCSSMVSVIPGERQHHKEMKKIWRDNNERRMEKEMKRGFGNGDVRYEKISVASSLL